MVIKEYLSTGYYIAVVVNKDCSWGGYKRQFFSIFFAFSKPVYQNEWENALGGVIFGLLAVWTTLDGTHLDRNQIEFN